MTSKQMLIAGATLAGLAVGLGAVGSHALKEVLLAAGRTETFETGVRYQLYHGLGLMLIGVLGYVLSEIRFAVVGILFLAGSVLFSGSLYLLSLTSIRWVVYATPLGGFMMIAGWLLLVVRLLRLRK